MKIIHSHRHTRCYGSPKMTRQLQALGYKCSENRIARLMRHNGLRSRHRAPFLPKTTRRDHSACPSPNLLADAAVASRPGAQLVSDITYIPTTQGWLYLAVVIDLFSRAIVGWKLSSTLHCDVVIDALQNAQQTGFLQNHAIFHSDRGCQYTASSTRQLLAHHGLLQSMSAKGCCYDNAFAESFFACLKSEILPDGIPFHSKSSASTAVFDDIETFYNRKRLHSSLGYLAPYDFLNQYFQNHKTLLN